MEIKNVWILVALFLSVSCTPENQRPTALGEQTYNEEPIEPEPLQVRESCEGQEQLPLMAPENPELSYSSDYKLHLYDSKEECQRGIFSNKSYLYQQSVLQKVVANACAWAKLMEGKRSLSECVQGRATAQGQILFDLKSSQEKQLLILVLDSDDLNRKMGKALSKTLIDVFDHLGRTNQQIPLTLARLNDETGTVDVILHAEELKSMFRKRSDKIPPELIQRVHELLPFSQDNIEPLEPLVQVDDKFKVSRLKGVLYITDADELPEREYILDSARLRGTPLHWKDSEVPFYVLTTGKCESWKAAKVRKCYRIEPNPTQLDQIRNKVWKFINSSL
ncbi:MAG: hypothetical protein ABFS56_10115 [Pseudomonadota bacterium]